MGDVTGSSAARGQGRRGDEVGQMGDNEIGKVLKQDKEEEEEWWWWW
jgi:hypothetical protein